MHELATPRTDAKIKSILSSGGELHWGDHKAETVASFARTLELELNEANLKRLEDFKAGALWGACRASHFLQENRLHPDIPNEELNQTARMAAHSVSQQIAIDIKYAADALTELPK